MTKRTILLGFCAFFLGSSLAFGQQSILGSNRVRIKTPQEKADLTEAVRLFRAAAEAFEAGQFATAESDARQCAAKNKGLGMLDQYVLAGSLLAEGRTQDALAAYAVWEDYSPRTLPYALLLLKTGHWSQALDAYNKILPWVGSFLSDGHDLLVADDTYTDSTPQPTDLETDIHIALGFAGVDDVGRAGTNSGDRALEEYREALKLEPDSPLANLAYAYGLKEDGKDASGAYQDVISRFSGDVKVAAEKELGTYQEPAPAPTNK